MTYIDSDNIDMQERVTADDGERLTRRAYCESVAADINAGEYVDANKIDIATDRLLADILKPKRRTPAQLTDQASLDGQSAEIDSMCSNDTEGM